MSFKLQDRTAVSQWIMRKLGGPLICVELAQAQLDDSIDDGIEWFISKKGIQKVRQFPLVPGQVEYPLAEDVDEVQEVIFAERELDFSTIFSPFAFVDKIPYDVFANPRGGGIYSSFTQALQYIESAKRIISVEPEWKVIHRTMYVFRGDSAIEGGATTAVMVFKPGFIDFEDLKVRDHDLIRRFALAEAKLTLSNVRGKYDRYPTAQGSVNLNADALYRQSKEEKESLEEQISQSAFPMPFMVG